MPAPGKLGSRAGVRARQLAVPAPAAAIIESLDKHGYEEKNPTFSSKKVPKRVDNSLKFGQIAKARKISKEKTPKAEKNIGFFLRKSNLSKKGKKKGTFSGLLFMKCWIFKRKL